MYMFNASTGNIICPVVMLNYLKGNEGNDTQTKVMSDIVY